MIQSVQAAAEATVFSALSPDGKQDSWRLVIGSVTADCLFRLAQADGLVYQEIE